MISDLKIDEIIALFKGDIQDLQYDYELSDIPGFREPADKRYDDKMIKLAEKVIEALKTYKKAKSEE